MLTVKFAKPREHEYRRDGVEGLAWLEDGTSHDAKREVDYGGPDEPVGEAFLMKRRRTEFSPEPHPGFSKRVAQDVRMPLCHCVLSSLRPR